MPPPFTRLDHMSNVDTRTAAPHLTANHVPNILEPNPRDTATVDIKGHKLALDVDSVLSRFSQVNQSLSHTTLLRGGSSLLNGKNL